MIWKPLTVEKLNNTEGLIEEEELDESLRIIRDEILQSTVAFRWNGKATTSAGL